MTFMDIQVPPMVMIVEDEADLAAVMADYVRAAGWSVTVLVNGDDALSRIRSMAPDLLVLDLSLPGLDGIAVCRALRGFSDLPVVMVTARVEEIDRLLGLEVGADDYLCKPFSPRELVARIKAIFRRNRSPAAARPALEIDEASGQARLHRHLLPLTPTEFALLGVMARRPGAIFSRAQLLDLVRGNALEITDRAIDSHIKNLRKKIAAVVSGRDVVQSVYGLGYRIEL